MYTHLISYFVLISIVYLILEYGVFNFSMRVLEFVANN